MDRTPLTPDKEPTLYGNDIPNPLVDPEYKGLVGYMDDLNYHQMAEFFEVAGEDRRDSGIVDKINFLQGWAETQTKSKDTSTQRLALKNLARDLGYPQTGSTLVRKLYQWTRLDQDRKRIDKEMEVLRGK